MMEKFSILKQRNRDQKWKVCKLIRDQKYGNKLTLKHQKTGSILKYTKNRK